MNQIVVSKATSGTISIDTVHSNLDTVAINLTTATIKFPKEQLTVRTIVDPLQGLDVLGFWITMLGGVAGVIAVAISFYQLFKKDTDKQRQINELANQTAELIKQNKLFEKRIKMMVKPRLWTNTSSHNDYERSFSIGIDNRGELAFVDDFEIIEGHRANVNKFGGPVTLLKDGSIKLTGSTDGSVLPSKMEFKLRLRYRDQENYRYETVFHWSRGSAKIMETAEIE